MLAIRLQRLGRKALPIYRLAVQDAQRHPSSGRVVCYVGTYNPHTKAVTLDKEKVSQYLKDGAQPTPRVVRLLQAEKLDMPSWVKSPVTTHSKATRKPAKLRKNQPKQPAPAAEAVAETPETTQPAEPDTASAETPTSTEA
ncbi:MAG TPA: 30S ribosomal protein S16 [Candidatus Acidoferrum sp.]|nr:30S ribosomal protein S16 [Candidatus Acidoferrum sp.]